MRRMSYAIAAWILTAGVGLSTPAYPAQTTDEIFANAALRSLHDLARAVARYEQAAKDADQLGCHDTYISMQRAAHEALTDMHSMSVAPIDAIEDVSLLLKISPLQPNECPGSVDVATSSLFLVAGQAIVALRYDY